MGRQSTQRLARNDCRCRQKCVCILRHTRTIRITSHRIEPFLFDRGEEATLALRRDAMVSWLALVEEVVLTHQQRQTANTTKITQFFIRRVPMTDIRVEADILRAPFSAEYYRRKMPNQRNKAQAGQPTNPKPPRPKRRANSRKEHLQQPSTTSIMAFSSGE